MDSILQNCFHDFGSQIPNSGLCHSDIHFKFTVMYSKQILCRIIPVLI
jgi:hypothetical protein